MIFHLFYDHHKKEGFWQILFLNLHKIWYVSSKYFSSLIELSLVKESLSIGDKVIAGQTLPPKEGFFFGNTEIDKWYEQDVKEAVEVFNKIVEEHSIVGHDASYTYQASW